MRRTPERTCSRRPARVERVRHPQPLTIANTLAAAGAVVLAALKAQRFTLKLSSRGSRRLTRDPPQPEKVYSRSLRARGRDDRLGVALHEKGGEMNRRRIVPLGLLLSAFCVSTVGPAGAAGATEREPRVWIANTVPDQLGGGHQVLLRRLGPAGAIEVDVIAPDDRVVSMVGSYGVGQRAFCEGVFLDEGSWFVLCDVYRCQFGSFRELLSGSSGRPGCWESRRYAFSAHHQECGATFLGSGRALLGSSPGANERLAASALLELTYWAAGDVEALRTALRLTCTVANPRLNRALAEWFGYELRSVVGEDQLTAVDEVPDELAARLDYERSRGLVDWLEHVVATLP